MLFSFPQLQYISAAATVDMYSDYKGKQLDDFFDLSLCTFTFSFSSLGKAGGFFFTARYAEKASTNTGHISNTTVSA